MVVQTIIEYRASVGQYQALWELNWVLPYATAYSRAFNSFKSELADQRKADELSVGIAVSLLSLGLAAGLGAAAGQTSLRVAVADRALQAIGRTNNIRLMRAANWFAESPTRSMIAGQTWDAVAGILSNQTKNQINRVGANNVSPSTYTRDPLEHFFGLKGHFLQLRTAAFAAATDIIENETMSQTEKDALGRRLAQEPFARAPSSRPPHMEENGRAQKDMEIAMFMAFVMTKDYTTRGIMHTSYPPPQAFETRHPITVPTTSENYPAARTSHGIGYTRRGYDRIGGTIERKVNDLVRERRFAEAFFYGSMGHDEIQRAERMLSRISERYSLDRLGPQY